MDNESIDEFLTNDPDRYAVLLEIAKNNFRMQVHSSQNYSMLVSEIRTPNYTDPSFDESICFRVSHSLKDWTKVYEPADVVMVSNSSPIVYLDRVIESFANNIDPREIYPIFLSTAANFIDFIKLGYRQPSFVIDWDEIESELEDFELDYSDLELRYQFKAPPASAMLEPPPIKNVTYSDLFNIEYEIGPIEETEEA